MIPEEPKRPASNTKAGYLGIPEKLLDYLCD
jgi:hypothetical protein